MKAVLVFYIEMNIKKSLVVLVFSLVANYCHANSDIGFNCQADKVAPARVAVVINAVIDSEKEDLVKIADSITTEGKILFKSEWASWYGTDIFLAKCQNKTSIIAGYISYDTGKGLNNVFFSKGDKPKVIGTTTFQYGYNPNNFNLDTVERDFTEKEKQLFIIRKATIDRINRDTLFKHYNNTNLNPVPIINNGVKKVYVLTGTNQNGVVIFGNDYLINFGNNDAIDKVSRLHKNIIVMNFGKNSADSNKAVLASIHTHLPSSGNFITATDVCTLMLYEKFTGWPQHIVVSKNYVSLWDCKKNELLILTMTAWKRIYADQSHKNK